VLEGVLIADASSAWRTSSGSSPRRTGSAPAAP
jgi:hypothetical protein